ncbi:MAG: c-type cytochrome [Gammaproteobacteria bacterium]
MKMILAGVLFFLLLAGIILGFWTNYSSRFLVVIHSLCFMTIVTLGYYGWQLVYGGRAPAGEEQYLDGQTVFDDRWTGCHAHGGNGYRPSMPLRSAPQLEEFEEFLAYLRNPRLPDGSKGMMPPFSPELISDQKARELYEYITGVIAKPKRK